MSDAEKLRRLEVRVQELSAHFWPLLDALAEGKAPAQAALSAIDKNEARLKVATKINLFAELAGEIQD